ncbi:MAG: hypothetical protein Q8K75_07415 [Chlamydiales bacterium]|nr:hypothetical protein [Chlamydiales bacterium]
MNDTDTFEQELTYFFGVSDEEPVVRSYMAALQQIELIGLDSIDLLEQKMLPHLEKAYQSVAEQRKWNFDIQVAAKIEFQIIVGNCKGSSFEGVCNLMIQLYNLVFQCNSPLIQKAAMLRTFLYQYKVHLLKDDSEFSQQDQRIMLELTQTSKKFLNSISG